MRFRRVWCLLSSHRWAEEDHTADFSAGEYRITYRCGDCGTELERTWDWIETRGATDAEVRQAVEEWEA